MVLVDSFRLCPLAFGVSVESTVVSDSHFGNFSFFNVCRFGFVFEFAKWIIFRVEIGRNFVFYGSLSKWELGSVGRTF